MDPKELRGLLEAYSEVYAPQEEIEEAIDPKGAARKDAAQPKKKIDVFAYDRKIGRKNIPPAPKNEEVETEEASYSAKAARAGKDIGKPGKAFAKIAKEAGKRYGSEERGKKVAGAVLAKLRAEDVEIDEATAMAKRGLDEPAIRTKIAKSTGGGQSADRATALADKQVFRGNGSARDNLARKQRGDFRKTTSSNPGLHGMQHKATTPADKAKQAARGAQRGVLTPDEKKRLNREEFDIFDVVLEFLQVEGYAETLEEAEWLMANVIDEEAIGIILGEDAGIISGLAGLALGAKGASYAAKHTKRMRDYPKNFVKGIVDPRTYGSKKKKEQKEEFVDEAQHARENPEKYERDQSKKSAPVRGERTPMPPRGDKRREDFEKWYAANVR